MQNNSWYSQFAKAISHFCGRPIIVVFAVLVILIWIITGPLFGFSDTKALQLKLDELIRSTKGAHNALLDLEELEEDQLERFRTKYEALATAARKSLEEGIQDTDTPETL